MVERVAPDSLERIRQNEGPECDTLRERMVPDRDQVRPERHLLQVDAVAERAGVGQGVGAVCARVGVAVADCRKPCTESDAFQGGASAERAVRRVVVAVNSRHRIGNR